METRADANIRLTNTKPSAIYRLRPHLPADAPLPSTNTTSGSAANLGIEIAPLPQLGQLLSNLGGEGKGKEVAGKVDVGKVAEKVVKNVRFFRWPSIALATPSASAYAIQ